LLERLRVALKDVLESFHGEDTFTSAALDGAVLGPGCKSGCSDGCGTCCDRASTMGDSLFVELPLSNRVKSFLAKGVVLDDFPARPEDSKDLNSHDGDGEPVTGGQFMSCVKGR